MKRYGMIWLALFSLLLSACAGSSGTTLEVRDPWVRAALMGGAMGGHGDTQMGTPAANTAMSAMQGGATSGAFMVINNSGTEADRLVKAESDVADAVELHLSEMKDGVMTMRQVEGVEIPASGQAELKPGSYHIMLIGLKQDLKEGDTIKITLTFEKGGSIVVDAPVKAP